LFNTGGIIIEALVKARLITTDPDSIHLKRYRCLQVIGELVYHMLKSCGVM